MHEDGMNRLFGSSDLRMPEEMRERILHNLRTEAQRRERRMRFIPALRYIGVACLALVCAGGLWNLSRHNAAFPGTTVAQHGATNAVAETYMAGSNVLATADVAPGPQQVIAASSAQPLQFATTLEDARRIVPFPLLVPEVPGYKLQDIRATSNGQTASVDLTYTDGKHPLAVDVAMFPADYPVQILSSGAGGKVIIGGHTVVYGRMDGGGTWYEVNIGGVQYVVDVPAGQNGLNILGSMMAQAK